MKLNVTQFCKSVLLACSLLAGGALASDFGVLDARVGLVSGASTTGTDYLKSATPNQYGISVSTYSNFVVDSPLIITNTPSSYGQFNNVAAKVIVIRSANIEITSRIEIIGQTADILFLPNGSGSQMSCARCEFVNVGRVTFANAEPVNPLNTASPNASIGELRSDDPNAEIGIYNLNAPGATSVEFVGYQVTTVGFINTQQRATALATGGYTLDKAGPLVVGAGMVNIFPRSINWNYETLAVTQVRPVDLPYILRGTIKSAAITVSSPSALTVTGTLDTRSDVLAQSNYRQRLKAIPEGIRISTLAGTQGNLTIKGNLQTDSTITLMPSGNLENGGKLEAGTKGTIDIIAIGSVFNKAGASINAATVNMAALKLENNGLFKGDALTLNTDQDMQNRFGGRILGDVISLRSEKGLIRNGSQYPYLPKTETALIYKDYLTLPDYQKNLQLGTLDAFTFNPDLHIITPDLSAKIIGGTIKIDAASSFENINPYIELLDDARWATTFVFDQGKSERVAVLAKDNLSIAASQPDANGNPRTNSAGRVLNSSAVIAVTSPSSFIAANAANNFGFKLAAPLVMNERYIARAMVGTFTDSTRTGLQSQLKLYSPPGVIYSFAPLNWLFSSVGIGGFVNNASYFEAFDMAKFETNNQAVNPAAKSTWSFVRSTGLAMSREFLDKTIGKVRAQSLCLVQNAISEKVCGTSNAAEFETGNLLPAQALQQSLFSVKDVDAPNISVTFENRDFLGDVEYAAISNAISSFERQALSDGGNVRGSYSGKISDNGAELVLTTTYSWSPELKASCARATINTCEADKSKQTLPEGPIISKLSLATILNDAIDKLYTAVNDEITAFTAWLAASNTSAVNVERVRATTAQFRTDLGNYFDNLVARSKALAATWGL